METDANTIIENVSLLLNDQTIYTPMAHSHNPYGDGIACKKTLKNYAKF